MLGPARIQFKTAEDLPVGRFRLGSRPSPTSRSATTRPPPSRGRPRRSAPHRHAPRPAPLGQGGRPRPAWCWSRAASRSAPGRWPPPRSRSAGPSSPTSPWPTRASPATTPGGARGRRLHRRGPALHQRDRGQRPADPAPPPGQRRPAQAGIVHAAVPAGGLMPPIFLLAVKVAFLVILYLFVAQVSRAVTLDVFGPRAQRRRALAGPGAPIARWRGPAGPAGRPGACPGSGGDRRGRPAHGPAQGVAHRGTGRHLATFAICRHLRVQRARPHLPARRVLVVEDLGSTNGTYMNRTQVQQPTAIGAGRRGQAGQGHTGAAPLMRLVLRPPPTSVGCGRTTRTATSAPSRWPRSPTAWAATAPARWPAPSPSRS